MRTLTAKYNGKCQRCGGGIQAGESIRWERGYGSEHFDKNVCRDELDFRGEESAEREQARREDARMDADYRTGMSEVAAIQAVTVAGSEMREAMYRDMELAAYNRGEDY